jgi:exodeoxyribonuclease V gamma subunit
VKVAETIRLEELIRFFKDPTRTLLSRQLKLNLRAEEATWEDREPVELNDLEKWQLKDDLLGVLLSGRSTRQAGLELRAAGTIPLGYAGRVETERFSAIAEQMLQELNLVRAGGGLRTFDPPKPIDLALGDIRLVGSADTTLGETLFGMAFGDESGKRLIGPWLTLLAWSAMEPADQRLLMALGVLDKGVPKARLLGFGAPEEPETALAALVELYRRGLREPLRLFSGASWAFAKRVNNAPGDRDPLDAAVLRTLLEDSRAQAALRQGLDDALGSWVGGKYGAADREDPHVARVWEGRWPMKDEETEPVPIDSDFARCALSLYGPLLKARHTGRSKEVKGWLKEVNT